MKALILYSHMAGYFYDCLKTLIDQTDIDQVLVICYSPSSIAPFQFVNSEALSIIYREDHSSQIIEKISLDFCPDIVYLSGWSNYQYLQLGKKFKKQGIPVVMGLDNQWSGSIKQQLGKILYPFIYRRSSTHIWVAGIYQYEFARRLGYKKEQILFNLYSANVPLFSKDIRLILDMKKNKYPRIILFVGRFVPEKGISILIDVFRRLKEESSSDWQLWMVGNGPLKEEIYVDTSITVLDFLQPHDLPNLMHRCGVFCLPSNFENWGVVIHEAAAAGLPIITSDACGAGTAFVKHNYNGLVFKSEDKGSLYKCLYKIMSATDDYLLKMAVRSVELSQQITPQVWAATFTSLLEK